MVELFVTDFEEETALQMALNEANIEYQLGFDTGCYGIQAPYIVVNGVPLGERHAMIWIKEHCR